MKSFDLGYLTIDSITEGVGTSQVLTLLEELSKLEMRISLTSFEKSPAPKFIQDRVQSAGITWNPLPFGRNGNLPGALRALTLKKNLPNSKILHGRSDIPSMVANNSNLAPVVWDVRSLWGAQRAILNPTQVGSVLKLGLEKIEGYNAHNAAAMTTLTRAIVPYLYSKHKRLPLIQDVVPTCVDLQRFALKSSVGRDLTVLLSGSFNNFYDIERTNQIIEALKAKINTKVIWARDSAGLRTNVPLNVDQIETYNHSDMPKVIESSSFGLVIIREDVGPSLMAAMPTKVAEFWATGRPVLISGGIGDLDEMVGEYRSGFVIRTGENLNDGIEQMIRIVLDPDTPERCRNLAEKYFDIQAAAKKYKKIYDKLS
jgi:glycosyltransferase involved in cell wall biosynthesis